MLVEICHSVRPEQGRRDASLRCRARQRAGRAPPGPGVAQEGGRDGEAGGAAQPITVIAILKIGRYIAITIAPTRPPMITMMNGSIRLESASTALFTSSS